VGDRPKADDAYVAAVATTPDTDPRALDYGFSVWTLNKLRLHLAKITGSLLSYSRMRALLRKHGYIHRQPKHDLDARQDEQAKAAAQELLEWLKKALDDAFVLLFVDETSLSLHPPLRRCWMRCGQRKQIAAPGLPQFVHVFGAYTWRIGEVIHQSHKHKNSDSFIELLEHVMQTVPADQKVVMVLDNASYHRSYAARAALALFEARLRVVYLPKYCPFLNPIERFWLQLKTLAAANHLHQDLDELRHAIAHVIHQQNQSDSSERLYFAHYFRLTA
jgi:transposase